MVNLVKVQQHKNTFITEKILHVAAALCGSQVVPLIWVSDAGLFTAATQDFDFTPFQIVLFYLYLETASDFNQQLTDSNETELSV